MKKPVLFRVTNNLNIGGVQRRLRSLLPLLTDSHEVHIVTYKDRGVLYDELRELGVHTHFLPRKGHWNPRAIRDLARLFRQHRADIVHTHSFGGNICGILAASLARVPVRIGQVHLSEMHWYGSTPWRRRKQMFEETWVHRLCTHKILFVSRESRDYFQRHTGLPDAMLQILHNGLDLPDACEAAPRQELGLPENTILAGFVGRLARGKGLDFFLDMAAAVEREAPGIFHFPVFGGHPDLTALRDRIRARGLDKYVTLLGERQDIHRCYAALDCLVFCSEAGVEGMPGVALEACAHGLPVLSRRIAPMEEIRRYYARIAFLDEGAPFAPQLQHALSLPEADRSALYREFSIQAMRDRTLELYSKLRGDPA